MLAAFENVHRGGVGENDCARGLFVGCSSHRPGASSGAAWQPVGVMLILLALLWESPLEARAQLELRPGQELAHKFGAREGTLSVVWRNQSGNQLRVSISARVYQTTSATAAPYSKRLWKTLELLPGQTILESATFDFPLVRGETPFLIQWVKERTTFWA